MRSEQHNKTFQLWKWYIYFVCTICLRSSYPYKYCVCSRYAVTVREGRLLGHTLYHIWILKYCSDSDLELIDFYYDQHHCLFHKQKCLITAQSWDAHQILAIKTLVYTGKQPLTLVMMGGGGAQSAPPLFLFVKSIEKGIGLCTVWKKKQKEKEE